MSATRAPTAASAVLLVRPDHLAHNPETAATNAFASTADPGGERATVVLRRKALEEHDGLARALRERGVQVTVVEGVPGAPDAVFPNNWVSFHRDGTAVLYPMESPTRRLEVRPEVVERLRADGLARPGRLVDLTGLAAEGAALEGTGSLVLDRAARLAYAARSPRTDERALARWRAELGYDAFLFDATDAAGRAIYHTNVLLALGTGFAVVADEAVEDPDQREQLLARLAAGGRLLVRLDRTQMASFAANLLELRGGDGEPFVVLSTRAHRALRPDQRAALSACAELVPVPLDTIESVGGGSVRCALCELAW